MNSRFIWLQFPFHLKFHIIRLSFFLVYLRGMLKKPLGGNQFPCLTGTTTLSWHPCRYYKTDIRKERVALLISGWVLWWYLHSLLWPTFQSNANHQSNADTVSVKLRKVEKISRGKKTWKRRTGKQGGEGRENRRKMKQTTLKIHKSLRGNSNWNCKDIQTLNIMNTLFKHECYLIKA